MSGPQQYRGVHAIECCDAMLPFKSVRHFPAE